MSKLNSTGSLRWMSEPWTKYDDTTLSETEHWTDGYSLSISDWTVCCQLDGQQAFPLGNRVV